MGDTNRVAVRGIKEVTPGTTPAAPAFSAACHTGATLASSPETIQSERICGGSSRGIKDLSKVGETVGEGFTFEYYFGLLDLYAEGIFQRAWGLRNRRVNTNAGDSVDRPAADEITGVSTTIITVASGTAFTVGHLVFLSGFDGATNSGLKVVNGSPSATTIPIAGLTTEASPPSTAEVHSVGVEAGSGDVATTVSGGNALTSSTLDFTTLGLAVGDWIKVGDDNNIANRFVGTAAVNSWCRVSVIAANRLDFDRVPTGWAADTGSGKTIRLFFGDTIWDGSTAFAYSLEEDFQDLSPQVYQYFRGMHPARCSFGGSAKAKIEGDLSFFGLTGEITETRFASASSVSDPDNDTMNTSSSVGRIAEGGSPIVAPVLVRNATIEIDNTLRRKDGWGVSGAGGIGSGDFAASVSAELFFENKTLREKVINNTESSFEFVFTDADGQAVVWDFPRGKFESGDPTVSGRNEDTTISPTFRALEHATLGYTCKHQRFFHAGLAV